MWTHNIDYEIFCPKLRQTLETAKKALAKSGVIRSREAPEGQHARNGIIQHVELRNAIAFVEGN